LGGFKRSSQQLEEGGCDEQSKAVFGSVRASAIVVTGSPSRARDACRRFCASIAAGMLSENAAVGAGVPPAAGTRWFRKAGCMHQ
jgi:hypothetical protein